MYTPTYIFLLLFKEITRRTQEDKYIVFVKINYLPWVSRGRYTGIICCLYLHKLQTNTNLHKFHIIIKRSN